MTRSLPAPLVVWPPFGQLADPRAARRDDAPVRRTDPAAVRLPPDLAGPVDVELTRAVEDIPGPNALPGGSRYEPKFD
ncbi:MULTISPECIES: hypothetical protein [Kribbella]|uniref:hypothetical protein n=1 Tax=Kribbella TaxID=182639 RepID=UPI00104681BD|nr:MULTISPECIES: hypothetical protein [Kribbella]